MVNVAKIAVGVLLAVALALGIYGWMLSKAPTASDYQVQTTSSDTKSSAAANVVLAAKAVPAGQVLKAVD